MTQYNEATITIPQGRYDDLIRSEVKYNLLRNALEDSEGYINVDDLKKHFGIPTNIYEMRKETANE